MNSETEIAVFGGGCFWCTEATFKMLKGVLSVEPGYAGGGDRESGRAPTYEEVSRADSGYAEVVRIEFDPSLISYLDLLSVFFAVHDPTTLNRQGADVGEQYRSVVFYTNENHKKIAEEIVEELAKSGEYKNPIVTKIEPLRNYFSAEDYHKDYYEKNQDAPYCQIVIAPKLQKLRERFEKLVK